MAIDKRIPIYRFVVGEDDDAGVTAVALVDNPAIEMNWQAFNSQVNIIVCKNCGHSWDVKDGGEDPYMCKCGTYNDEFVIEPKDNESEDEFISRCIAVEVGNGYEQEQAAAICYSKWDKQKMSKFSSNKEKKIISGALMVADLPIYRKDEQGEYYGLFTAEDIYNIRNKFFKNNNTKSVNEMHDPNKMIEGVYMIESFIIDSKRGINAPDGLKLTDGSWFGSYKVDNEDIWNDFIKTGEFKGFSVEGVFKTTQIDAKPLSIIEQAIDIIKQIED